VTIAREPPYPPPPRHEPEDLSRPASAPIRVVGILAHLLGVGLYASAPLVCLAAAYWCLQADWWIAPRAFGFIVCLALAVVYLKSLLPRRLPMPPAVIPVQSDDQSTPYAFLTRVAADLGAHAPRKLWFGSGVELRVGGRRSLFDLIRKGSWDFQVGLWLVHSLTLSEFQALAARTLAPLGRGRIDRVAFKSQTLLEALTEGVDWLDELGRSNSALASLGRAAGWVYAAAIAPVSFVGRILLRVGTPRDQDFADDLASVRIAGSDALVHAVLRSDFAGATLRELDEALLLAARDGVYTRDLFAHVGDGATILREAHNDFTLGEPPFLRGPTAGKHAEVFEPGQRYLSSVWRGFPGPSEREHNAKRTFVAAERDDRPAAELLDNPARLREKLTVLRYVETFRTGDDFIPFPAEVVCRWLTTRGEEAFPGKYAGCYDGGRRIQPGSVAECESALTAETWDDARLLSTEAGLYRHAGERASRWRATRTAHDRLMRRTFYHPTGRERAYADDLADDLRKCSRWLAALDRWAYVVHVHMAARLPDLGLHDELLNRYESVLRFQTIAADAREYRNRTSVYVEQLDRYAGPPPYRLARDAGREFDASRKDFYALLEEAEIIDDAFINECTGGIRLHQFLYAHDVRPVRGDPSSQVFGRLMLEAWTEIAVKAHWLHRLGVAALLTLHERILTEFSARCPALPLSAVTQEIPDVIVLDPLPEPPPLELELVEPDIVDEPDPSSEEPATDPWEVR
jgi:hypothetical protein